MCKMDDCIRGLIGMSCHYVKQLEKTNENECVNLKWANVTRLMADDKIYLANNLGINECPGSTDYFIVYALIQNLYFSLYFMQT